MRVGRTIVRLRFCDYMRIYAAYFNQSRIVIYRVNFWLYCPFHFLFELRRNHGKSPVAKVWWTLASTLVDRIVRYGICRQNAADLSRTIGSPMNENHEGFKWSRHSYCTGLRYFYLFFMCAKKLEMFIAPWSVFAWNFSISIGLATSVVLTQTFCGQNCPERYIRTLTNRIFVGGNGNCKLMTQNWFMGATLNDE